MVNNYLISGGVTARQISTTFTDTETTHVPKKLVCFSSYTEKWSKITLLTHVFVSSCSEVNSTCFSLSN